MAEKTSQIWKIKLSSKAEKNLMKFSRTTRESIKAGLIQLSKYQNPIQHPDARPLIGALRGMNRLRVGKYRIMFGLFRDSRILAVINITSRGSAYK